MKKKDIYAVEKVQLKQRMQYSQVNKQHNQYSDRKLQFDYVNDEVRLSRCAPYFSTPVAKDDN